MLTNDRKARADAYRVEMIARIAAAAEAHRRRTSAPTR